MEQSGNAVVGAEPSGKIVIRPFPDGRSEKGIIESNTIEKGVRHLSSAIPDKKIKDVMLKI
jgi:hypothetical protein